MTTVIIRRGKVIDGVLVPGRFNALGDFIPERYRRGAGNLLAMTRVGGELKSRRKARRKSVARLIMFPKRP